mmetsp:Transcript_10855/g.26021  ORF Transcript_10855/g.26021 Transcript_10855/m.26021 type:complete len:110 (+) Transcript_10855:181-510(+)
MRLHLARDMTDQEIPVEAASPHETAEKEPAVKKSRRNKRATPQEGGQPKKSKGTRRPYRRVPTDKLHTRLKIMQQRTTVLREKMDRASSTLAKLSAEAEHRDVPAEEAA